jgi:hypothetical protein
VPGWANRLVDKRQSTRKGSSRFFIVCFLGKIMR